MTYINKLIIDASLVRRLITTQFPQLANLEITPVQQSGWDNRTFHLGKRMTVRLPSQAEYAEQAQKEYRWLSELGPQLPLAIPIPLALGKPSEEYPWHWSIYNWLNGDTATVERIEDLNRFAMTLANFLITLQKCQTTNGPVAGPHSFYRGGELATYDAQTKQAIDHLSDQIDKNLITEIWHKALASIWNKPPVWVHGDIAPGNLLVEEGKLSAVIDFGQLCIGDPACDLAIAWTFFKDESRDAFRAAIQLDDDTWARGRGWALWKALIICAGLGGTDPEAIDKSWQTLNEIFTDYKEEKTPYH
jgi:aminoglycoside phosphotransferase (APT) family kinase protein